ncbi:MAG: T9SS type A sorting domain-containing protein [Candidatus Coatesbacteria bacterium]|nr:MAG: T9SS type A sorting domain-containing protein [Candidatus Coatesbacteria bacterium]
MKSITGLLIITLTPLIFASAASDVVSWARVYTPTEDAFESVVYRHDLDIASGRRAEYVEVIAPQSKLDAIGYAYEYLQYDCLSPESFAGRGYAGYHNYDELLTDLNALADKYPDICTLTNTGQGHVGLGDIWLLKISDDVAEDATDEADLLITGVHHAREPMSLEVPLAFAQYLCNNYDTKQGVQDVVDKLEFYIMPLMNVDGYVYDDVEGERNYWRKNGYDWPGEEPYDFGSGRGTGVDPNRNYTYMWGYDDYGSDSDPYGQTYRGPSAGSEPENQIVMDLSCEKRFKAAISYHQHGELILRPWGYIDAYTDDDDKFVEMSEVINDVINEHGRDYEIIAGWEFYNTNGDFVDYMYGEHGVLGITIELNSSGQGGFYPDESWIEPTCNMMTDAMMAWAEWCINEFTDVELDYFTAEWNDGSAELSWDVSDGSTAAGFNLYREPDDGTRKTLVNSELISGEPPYKYVDATASPAVSYDYYLEALDGTGAATTHGPVHLEASGGTKTAFALYQTTPNPTAGAAIFRFSVADDSDVELTIYDISGRKVLTVADGPFATGEHSVAADLSSIAPGVYVYRLIAGGENAARKLVVTR